MEKEFYPRSPLIRQRGLDTNIWYHLGAAYVVHPLLVRQLATPFYREGTTAAETLRRADSPSH